MPMCIPGRLRTGRRSGRQQIALGTGIHAVPGAAPGSVGLRAGPEAKAFVMLGGQHHVLRPGTVEEVGPVIGIEELGLELRGEILVLEVLAVDPLVKLPPGVVAFLLAMAFQYHSAYCPLGTPGRAPSRRPSE